MHHFIALLVALFCLSSAWAVDLAKVNGRVITSGELDAALAGLPEGQRANIMKDESYRKQIVSGLVEQELLVEEAEKEKLDQDSEYKNAMTAFKKQYLSNKVLQKNLGPKLGEKAVKKYYETNKSRYSTDMVHAQHILVKTLGEAKDVLKKAKEPNADFQALAEKYSRDPSAKNNRGDLGFFGRDRMVPPFTEAAFAAKAGEIVGPIETAYGFHIIKVLEKKAGKVMDFADVEMKVQNDLRQELAQNFVAKLRSDAKIEMLDKNAGNKK